MSRLSRDDWARAALLALGDGGVSSVSVERLAASLGATKGSFYWHFSARDELVSAALEMWEQRSTTDVIDAVEAAGGSAEDRLRLLFSLAFDPSTLTGVDVSLLSHADEPVVAGALERVTATRMTYVAGLLRESGLSAADARRWSVFVYSAFIGHLHLRHADPDLVKRSVGSVVTYTDEVVDTLLSRVPPARR